MLRPSSKSSLGNRNSYCPASKYVSALARSLPLVSPFQGCPPLKPGQSLPRSPDRRWYSISLRGLLVTISMKYAGSIFFMLLVLIFDYSYIP
ncbi:MAG: hypothetical protein QE493_01175 [Verrucomicrobiae bacterium]|nr:hypothetical protein [Verrucomicrobiae bacterium]